MTAAATPTATSSRLDHGVVETPIGPLHVVLDDDGFVVASGWSIDLFPVLERAHPTLRGGQLHERRDLGDATKAVRDWIGGDLDALARVPYRQLGGPFLERAWRELHGVPGGTVVTYTELARLAGRPTAVRAAAQACARNAVAPYVPCHRVLRSDGALGGFRWGLDVKRWILHHEASRT